MTKDAKLIAIVPVYNGGDDIQHCLQGLIDAGLEARDILVVDDSSTDDSARVTAHAAGCGYHELSGGPFGPAQARNAGTKLTPEADVWLFVDADVVVHPDAVNRFREWLSKDCEVAAVFGSYNDNPSESGFISQYKNLLHHFMHQRGGGKASTFWSGCGMIKREPFLAMNGFDSRYSSASIEDIDLGMRLVAAGYRIELCPLILCTHRKKWTLTGWLRTDIFNRALPWSRLLVQGNKRLPDTLNIGTRERVSAVLSLLFALALLSLPLAPTKSITVLVIMLSLFVVSQRELFSFFARSGGWLFAASTVVFHLMYFCYSSTAFIVAWCESKLVRAHGV